MLGKKHVIFSVLVFLVLLILGGLTSAIPTMEVVPNWIGGGKPDKAYIKITSVMSSHTIGAGETLEVTVTVYNKNHNHAGSGLTVKFARDGGTASDYHTDDQGKATYSWPTTSNDLGDHTIAASIDGDYDPNHDSAKITVVKYKLELPVENKDYAMDMARPTMPTVPVRVEDPKLQGTVQYRYIIGDPGTGRILEYEDAPTDYSHPSGVIDSGWVNNREWDINFGSNIYGGHITHIRVQIKSNGTVVYDQMYNRNCYIVGASLTTTARNAYIDSLNQYTANIRTMAKAIALQETGGTQFWPGHGVGTASHIRYPLVSTDGKGYGVMQLSTSTLLSVATIWNWKRNIDAAMQHIQNDYNASVAQLNQHPVGITDRMKRLGGYCHYNGGAGNRYYWWSTGPTNHGGVPMGWTKFGYVVCPGNATNGFRDNNNDGIKDPDGNPYNIPNFKPRPIENKCVARAQRYADHVIQLEP